MTPALRYAACAGDALRESGRAGIGVAQRDDVVTWAGHAREQDRGFVRFGAGAGEEALLQFSGRDLGELFGERDDGFVGEKRRGVLELVDLRLDLRSDLGIAVADADGDDAAEEIEVFVALDVPEILHRGVVGDERMLVIIRDRRPEIFLVLADDLFAAAGGCLRLGRHARLLGTNSIRLATKFTGGALRRQGRRGFGGLRNCDKLVGKPESIGPPGLDLGARDPALRCACLAGRRAPCRACFNRRSAASDATHGPPLRPATNHLIQAKRMIRTGGVPV